MWARMRSGSRNSFTSFSPASASRTPAATHLTWPTPHALAQVEITNDAVPEPFHEGVDVFRRLAKRRHHVQGRQERSGRVESGIFGSLAGEPIGTGARQPCRRRAARGGGGGGRRVCGDTPRAPPHLPPGPPGSAPGHSSGRPRSPASQKDDLSPSCLR